MYLGGSLMSGTLLLTLEDEDGQKLGPVEVIGGALLITAIGDLIVAYVPALFDD